jgi:hypothetical protein
MSKVGIAACEAAGLNSSETRNRRTRRSKIAGFILPHFPADVRFKKLRTTRLPKADYSADESIGNDFVNRCETEIHSFVCGGALKCSGIDVTLRRLARSGWFSGNR